MCPILLIQIDLTVFVRPGEFEDANYYYIPIRPSKQVYNTVLHVKDITSIHSTNWITDSDKSPQ